MSALIVLFVLQHHLSSKTKNRSTAAPGIDIEWLCKKAQAVCKEEADSIAARLFCVTSYSKNIAT
jgi:hypothetical protein